MKNVAGGVQGHFDGLIGAVGDAVVALGEPGLFYLGRTNELAAKEHKDHKEGWVKRSQSVDEKGLVNKRARVRNTCSRWFCAVFTAAVWARVSNCSASKGSKGSSV